MSVFLEVLHVDSVLFDLDGTLWNASRSAAKAWNLAFKDIGYTDVVITEKDIQNYSGIRINKLLHDHFSFIPENKREEFISVYSEYEKVVMKEGGELFDDVESNLNVLYQTKKLFIVSNCLEGYIENFLDYTKMNKYFTGYALSGKSGIAKSKNIEAVINKYNLKNPVFVGDTQYDFQASEEAGIPFVYASYGFGKVNEAKYKIERFNDLLKIIN